MIPVALNAIESHAANHGSCGAYQTLMVHGSEHTNAFRQSSLVGCPAVIQLETENLRYQLFDWDTRRHDIPDSRTPGALGG